MNKPASPSLPISPIRHPASGFSLIELMIAVAISGIIAAVALPAYTSYVTQGKIPDALSLLSTKQLQIEQAFLDSRTYIGAAACVADTASSKYFDFSCTTQTATTYTLKATGKNTMAGFAYTIDQTNTKTTFAVPTGWAQPSPNTCWVTKKGGVC